MGISQKSFASGEITPALYARTDQSKYGSALRTCRNFFVMRHGGAANRPGTQFVGEVADSSKTVRLIPFIFNDDQTYVLEFGDETMRVIKDGAYLTLTAQNISGISNANPAVLTYAGADNYANGDQVYITGVVGAIGQYVNGRTFIVANVNVGANTFELDYLDGTDANSTTWGAYASAGTIAEIYEVAASYAEAALQNLKFSQSADVITFAHPSYAPGRLSRTGDTAWAIASITFAPKQAAPSALTHDGTPPGAGSGYKWVVTAISDSGEESLAAVLAGAPNDKGATSPGTVAVPIHLEWTAAAGAAEYRIYRAGICIISAANQSDGFYSLVGSTVDVGFTDEGFDRDLETRPNLVANNPFSGADNYPSSVVYSKQRIFFTAPNNNPSTTWGSKIGHYDNFEIANPVTADSPIEFTLAGTRISGIRHLIEVGNLIALSSQAEQVLQGNADGVITPTEVNPKQYSNTGSSQVPPIVVDGTVLFIQARGGQIRDMGFNFQSDTYKGNELSIFASHLLKGKTVRDWAYQQIPHSIVWVVTDDGALLGMTYVREHQLLAWHRHDFQGDVVEQVCSVPEDEEDAVYLVIKRTIDGDTVRYVERLNTREFEDITDAIFMDSALSYDGTNAAATTMTLSGGTTWEFDEKITLTSSVAFFTADDVGNWIVLTGSGGIILRCRIVSYTNTTVVSVFPHMDVPTTLQATATAVWSKAVDEMTGLWHLEGEEVSVFADGAVVASPNNASFKDTLTVASGKITLDKPFVKIHVGLPIISDLETLNIDTVDGQSMIDKKKQVNKVSLWVEDTRGIWVGGKPPSDDDTDPLENLNEAEMRSQEDYDVQDEKTEVVDVNVRSEWNSNGRIFMRQVDPIPVSILSVTPSGFIPNQRG